ncbi:MAG: response regulator transcription factor [Chloroflexi bacterium]|nr:MAG: response regulator transcription factor [Chloroflexota bacterium]
MMKRILIVEDDDAVAEALTYNLKWNGYDVDAVTDGVSALKIIREDPPDLLILDVALPKMNGLDVCRQVRRTSSVATLPIIMLTARGNELDKEVGLDAGADDYVTKPFERRELLARVRALLRRSRFTSNTSEDTEGGSSEVLDMDAAPKTQLTIEPLEIDITGRRVTCRGRRIDLTYRQFELLLYLVRNRGIILTRDQLLRYVWGHDYIGDPRTLDVHIHWLRENIEEDPKNPKFIHTVRGIGYCFK